MDGLFPFETALYTAIRSSVINGKKFKMAVTVHNHPNNGTVIAQYWNYNEEKQRFYSEEDPYLGFEIPSQKLADYAADFILGGLISNVGKFNAAKLFERSNQKKIDDLRREQKKKERNRRKRKGKRR